MDAACLDVSMSVITNTLPVPRTPSTLRDQSFATASRNDLVHLSITLSRKRI